MGQPTTLYVGLDNHKESISVSYAAAERREPPQFVGPIGTRRCDIDKMTRRLQSKASHQVFAYEAGPCGYVLYRYLTSKGFDCQVVAPSLMPKRPGDRVKNDRRDSMEIARLLCAPEISRRSMYRRSRMRRSGICAVLVTPRKSPSGLPNFD